MANSIKWYSELTFIHTHYWNIMEIDSMWSHRSTQKVLWFQGRIFNLKNPEFYRHNILEKWVRWWNGMCLWIWLVSILICRIGNASHVGLILNLKVGLDHLQRNFVFGELRDFNFGLEIKSDRIWAWFEPDQTSWNQISLLRWLHQKHIETRPALKSFDYELSWRKFPASRTQGQPNSEQPGSPPVL